MAPKENSESHYTPKQSTASLGAVDSMDSIARLAARLLGLGRVVVADRKGGASLGSTGFETGVSRDLLAFCVEATGECALTVIEDVPADGRFCEHPAIAREDGVRFFVAARLGPAHAICAFDSVPRTISPADQRLLLDLAAMAEASLHGGSKVETSSPYTGTAAFEAIIQSADVGILITDPTLPDNPTVFVNPAFERITGYSREDVLGRNSRFLQTEGTDPEVLARLRDSIKARKSFRGLLLNRRKDGSSFWNELVIDPVFDRAGRLVSYVGIQNDVTGWRQSEDKLRLAKEEAERASAAKNEFLSRMSHELRTPLNAILGFSQLLLRGAIGGRAAEQVRHISQAGQHLLDLVTEVLDLARIEAGGTSLSTEAVEVGEVLQSSLDLVRTQAEKNQIRFDYDAPEIATYLVIADRQRLKQIFVNLLSNAVKYNRVGGCVSIHCERAGEDQLRIAFRDTGEGISPEGMKRLFLPFERLVPQKSAIEGTGIGLAISQRLVKIMGGAIEVQSELGKGTTFAVLLPAGTRPNARIEGASKALIVMAPISDVQQTVLYVEDNPANLQLMEQIAAEHRGVRLVTATKGGEALALARAEKPRLILLDLHLPDIFGDTVLKQMRACAECRDIPIYMVSADAMEGQVARLLAEGANGYITKPIDVARMLELFHQHLTPL